MGYGGLSDVVEQSQIIQEFYDMCKQDETGRITLKGLQQIQSCIDVGRPNQTNICMEAEESVEVLTSEIFSLCCNYPSAWEIALIILITRGII